MRDAITIPIRLDNGMYIPWRIYYGPTLKKDSIQVLEEADALEYGEARIQLMEGEYYEYVMDPPYRIRDISRVVKSTVSNPSVGHITPGNYVGTLPLEILDGEESKSGEVSVEVRSVKASYRDDYRSMLEDITEKCTELLMQHSSPARQHFETDPTDDARTLYQRFAFVRSMLHSPELAEAIYRLQETPVTRWATQEQEVDIRRTRNGGAAMMRQLVTRKDRIPVPEDHCLRPILPSLPARVRHRIKATTTDTPENRFVKYVFSEFLQFCIAMRRRFKENSRAYREVVQLEGMLGNLLNHTMFREVSQPSVMALNSPVLQRKEGYREVLRVWLMFDLAARLVWKGGDDVYEAGKRDVAALYEYWVFFALLDIVFEIFHMARPDVRQLIEYTPDGLGLKLKLGKKMSFQGKYTESGRTLQVAFHYNRTVKGEKLYPDGGSWTGDWRPDYTLSIWPAEVTARMAEHHELMVHLHFDAKYRMEADIVKMHAYKDAIRRTAGAYVLYAGEKSMHHRAYHELLPGVGAFPLRPSRTDNGKPELKQFISQVVEHLLDRASQREELSYHHYRIHRKKERLNLRRAVPEYHGKERPVPPNEVHVLVGYCKDEQHYEWIESHGLYNIRTQYDKNPIAITNELCEARYLLLHREGDLITMDIRRIKGKAPYICTQKELLHLGYAHPKCSTYLVYEVEKKVDPNLFAGTYWDIRELAYYKGGRKSALPFVVTLTELMEIGAKK